MKHTRLSKDEIQYIFDNVGKKSTREIAEWIGCHVAAVNYRLRKRGIKHRGFSMWSQHRLDEMLALRCEGYSLEELAKHFNVSKCAVDDQIHLMRKKGIKVPTQWDVRNIKKIKQWRTSKNV